MSKLPWLTGDRVTLRALVEADVDGPYPGWLNDPEVSAGNSHDVAPYSREDALAYVRATRAASDSLVLAIDARGDGRHIGNIALQSIHPLHRSAELAILIGDKTAWGKGFGQEAARLLCRHAFEKLNLERIACGTYAHNTAMQRLALSLGMKEEGRRRAAAWKAGRFVDVVEYGLLRGELRT